MEIKSRGTGRCGAEDEGPALLGHWVFSGEWWG